MQLPLQPQLQSSRRASAITGQPRPLQLAIIGALAGAACGWALSEWMMLAASGDSVAGVAQTVVPAASAAGGLGPLAWLLTVPLVLYVLQDG